jgi:membrane protease YdiL (CAAX protease family)
MTPSPAQTPESGNTPFWGYEDLALFVGSVLPALAIATIFVRQFHFPNGGVQTLVFQCTLYVLLLGMLYLLIAQRYHKPFWRSLGWKFEYRHHWLYVFIGPPLAIALAALAAVLHAPANPTIQNLITDRNSLIAVVFFGAFAGPAFEEMVFRGFLQPLFERNMPAAIAILLAAIPFALLHGPGFGWAWQSMLVVGIAGLVMGFVRHQAGSTAAAALVHIGYNSTLFAGFLLQRSA